jgi:peptidoglycan/LPS O-acetylase OafA/YrhL
LKSTQGKYYEKLDHLRFLAALLVMFWHGMHFKNQVPTSSVPSFPLFSMLEEGHTGVSLFMVLSGYIFWQLCRNKEISYLGFLRNRFIRIAPLFFLYVFLMFKVNDIDPLKLFVSIVGLMGHTLPRVSWTIIVEFQFYIIFPFILLFTQKYGFRYVFGLLVLALIVRYGLWVNRGYIQDIAYWTIFGRIDQFILGILACELVAKHINLKLKFICGAIFIMLLLAFSEFNNLGGFYHIPVYPSTNGLWIIMPTLEGLMWASLIALYLSADFFLYSRISKIIAWFGAISFSFYLNHMFVIEFVYKIESKMNWLPSSIWNICLNIILVILPITLVFSSLTYFLIEKPFLSLRKNYVIKEYQQL